MTDRPILFSAPMVRALLAGTKTQTRRILKSQPGDFDKPFMMDDGSWHVTDSQGGHMSPLNVRYRAGDRLWVRESWWHVCAGDGATISVPGDSPGRDGAFFRADHPDYPPCPHYTARPSIFMPRWASRLTLTITDVRVQGLQNISEEDAIAEGIERLKSGRGFYDPTLGHAAVRLGHYFTNAREAYAHLWDAINGEDAWAENPWVVAVSFDVRKGNVDG